MPVSSTTIGVLASAHVEHPADQPAAAGHDAGPARWPAASGRASSGIASSSAWPPAANEAGEGTDVARRSWPPGSRRRRRACRSRAARARCSSSRRRPTRNADRQASTAPSCEPTWRWMPRQRSGPSRAAAGLDDRRQLLGQHAELRLGGTDGQAAVRLRRHGRVDADEHVDWRDSARRQAAAARPQHLPAISRLTHSSGVPARAARRGQAQSRASVLPIPSRTVRCGGHAGTLGEASSPPETALAPESLGRGSRGRARAARWP